MKTRRLPPMLACLMLTSACTVADITPHLPATPEHWSANKAQTAAPATPESLKAWWTQFHDADLNWLIAQTLKESPDIRQAEARIEEARGQQKSAFAALFPSIDAKAGATRSRSLFLAPITGNGHDASFDASYEIDLFGKNREASNAADLSSLAATKDYDWITLSMVAEVTRTYVAMRAAEKQISLAQKNLETEQQTLTLVKRQRQAGGSSNFDVERTALQVNQSASRIADYKRQRDIYALALMTLTGLPEAELLPHLHPTGEIPGMDLGAVADAPASVLARRPDIAAANLRFTQATALKQSQAASVFPSLSLSSMFGISKTVLVNSTSVWSLGANAGVNLLDFGRIQGQIDAASAREVAAYESWRKAILQGVQDVETALTNLSRIQEQRVSLTLAKSNAAKAVELAQVRYRAGDSSLLDVLDAQRQRIEADSALIDAESNYVTSLVALYKALGQY